MVSKLDHTVLIDTIPQVLSSYKIKSLSPVTIDLLLGEHGEITLRFYGYGAERVLEALSEAVVDTKQQLQRSQ